jgi:hypothetical protein
MRLSKLSISILLRFILNEKSLPNSSLRKRFRLAIAELGMIQSVFLATLNAPSSTLKYE